MIHLSTPFVYYLSDNWWILSAISPVIYAIDFLVSEHPWKNIQILKANGYTPGHIFIISNINNWGSILSYYYLFRVKLENTTMTYRFDSSLIITTILLLAIDDFLFYLAHKLLHITNVGAKIHLMHHCCIYSSQTTNLWFHPLDFIIEFFGPFTLTYIVYCIRGDTFELLFICSILQAWYATGHDENIKLPHYYHHLYINSNYPAYSSYNHPDPNNILKHMVKMPSPSIVSIWKHKMINKAHSNMQTNLTIKLHPSVKALSNLIKTNYIIKDLTKKMIQQYKQQHNTTDIPQSCIKNVNHMLQTINTIITYEPQFYNDKHLIGLPLSALFTGINVTPAGEALFRINKWNKYIENILKAWCSFLYTKESFPKNNSWLSVLAINKWAPKPIGMDLWILPKKENPYWDNWNAFFARDINRKYRPLANKKNIITSTNDGGLVRISYNIKLTDTFWLKDMPYSLTDIFGGAEHKLAQLYSKTFINGNVFQTFLSPFSYHCFWAPVSGKVVHISILPGLYFSKLIKPDYYGATTASCPYLMQVNARGIFIIDTKDSINIGLVCCIPIGMGEVSSIVFDENIKIGQNITKGHKLGCFAFGGSSFAILFEDVSKYNKKITFKNFTGEIKNDPMGKHSIHINVGSEIAVVTDILTPKLNVFTDKENNSFKIDRLSNRLYLFNETVELMTNSFHMGEPSCKCAKVSYDEVYYYMYKLLTKMKENNLLDMVGIVLNISNNELAFATVSADYFEDSIDLNENEWKELQNMNEGKFAKVLEFVEELSVNGMKALANKIPKEYANKIKNKEKGHFFHLYMGAANFKYAGKGATPLMYKCEILKAKQAGYSYYIQESTNPISQHLAEKYANAKTYYEMQFSDYFENFKQAGIAKEQTAKFQVVNL